MRTPEIVASVAIESTIDIASLPRNELETMAEAGQEIVEIFRILTKTGDNVVGEVLRDGGQFY